MGLDPLTLGLIAGGAGAIFGGHNQAKQNQQATAENQRVQKLIDQWLSDYKGYQGDVKGMLGGSPLLFGPRTTTSSGTSSSTSESTPTITPEYSPLAGMVRKQYEGRLTRGSSLPPGYEATQTRAINDSFAPAESTVRNLAARRNMSGDAALIGSPVERDRASKVSDLRAGLPLMERQMQTEDLTGASNLVSQFGRGERTSSSGRTSSSTTAPPDIGSILAYLGLLAPPQPPIVGAPSKPSALGAGITSGLDIGSLLFLLSGGQKPTTA